MEIIKSKSPFKRNLTLKWLRAFESKSNKFCSTYDYKFKKHKFYATENGRLLGGIFLMEFFNWLYVDVLCVNEQARGQDVGTKLMQKAESFAKANGFAGIYLNTFDFQARPFYEKLGFEVYGIIEDLPPGSKMYKLKKEI